MGKRGRPRKNPTPESQNTEEDGDEIGIPLDASLKENPRTVTSEENPPDAQPQPIDVSTLEEPEAWRDVPIEELGIQGWRYRRKADKKGIEYMHIRNRTNERGLGRYTPEREKLFFKLYPMFKPKNPEPELGRPEIVDSSGDRPFGKKPFFNIPIKRVAVIPGDYRPTMEVIRYFHIYKNNDFPGDFSDFMNGIILHHFVKCNGVTLPVYINEELTVQNA